MLIRWRRSARALAPISRSGPAPNSEVSRQLRDRPGTLGPGCRPAPAGRAWPTLSTVASESSSKDITRAIDRLVTLSAWTSRITWSCQPLTARTAWVGRSAEERPAQRGLAERAAGSAPSRPRRPPGSAARGAEDQAGIRGELRPAQLGSAFPRPRSRRAGPPRRVVAPAGRTESSAARLADRDDQRLDGRSAARLFSAWARAGAPRLRWRPPASPRRLQAAQQRHRRRRSPASGRVPPRAAASRPASRLVALGQRRPRRPPRPRRWSGPARRATCASTSAASAGTRAAEGVQDARTWSG